MEPKHTISASIKNRINDLKEGYIFSYREFENPAKNKEAIVKCLGRLVDTGKLHKLSKGKYYKPIKGNSKSTILDSNEIIKDLLEKNGKPIGYITGLNVFNRNLLNNSNANTILIGRNTFKPTLYRSVFTIKFILQRNEITNDNIEMLQVLDCLKMINNIPENNRESTLSNIGKVIRSYNKKDREKLIQCSLNYNSATRALLGVVLDTEKIKKGIDDIMETLNPISTYNIKIKKIEKALKDKWNIR